MSPVPYTWGPFLAKIFLKIDEIKIRPLTPPQNHFNTLPVLVADACIQEGWEKVAYLHFWAPPVQRWGHFGKLDNFLTTQILRNMSPVPYTWGPFLAKIFLKIDEIKIRPLTPPQNHFNTLPVLVADACIQEGWEKVAYLHFWAPPVQRWGHFGKLDNFLTT